MDIEKNLNLIQTAKDILEKNYFLTRTNLEKLKNHPSIEDVVPVLDILGRAKLLTLERVDNVLENFSLKNRGTTLEKLYELQILESFRADRILAIGSNGFDDFLRMIALFEKYNISTQYNVYGLLYYSQETPNFSNRITKFNFKYDGAETLEKFLDVLSKANALTPTMLTSLITYANNPKYNEQLTSALKIFEKLGTLGILTSEIAESTLKLKPHLSIGVKTILNLLGTHSFYAPEIVKTALFKGDNFRKCDISYVEILETLSQAELLTPEMITRISVRTDKTEINTILSKLKWFGILTPEKIKKVTRAQIWNLTAFSGLVHLVEKAHRKGIVNDLPKIITDIFEHKNFDRIMALAEMSLQIDSGITSETLIRSIAHNTPDRFAKGLVILHKNEAWQHFPAEERANVEAALDKHDHPENLAMGFAALRGNGYWKRLTDEQQAAFLKHPNPFSVASAVCALRSQGLWSFAINPSTASYCYDAMLKLSTGFFMGSRKPLTREDQAAIFASDDPVKLAEELINRIDFSPLGKAKEAKDRVAVTGDNSENYSGARVAAMLPNSLFAAQQLESVRKRPGLGNEPKEAKPRI